ncbi:Rap guanine nucleotide exchange factor [Paragonimus kellicotti]|nr:Rap guanine nucleotide exchange factor [Paragonimus kellicotti]
MDDEDSTAIRLLCVPSQHRTPADLAYLHAYLRTIEGLNVSGPTSAHRDAELRAICQIARHRRVPGDVILYRAGDFCDSWFILLTGSVLIETSMFLPRACFGLRLNGGAFRQNDCLVLEPSDLVVIDYPERDRITTIFTNTHRQAITCHKRRLSHDVPTDPTQFNSSNESSCALNRTGHTAVSSPVNDSQPPRIASSPSAASSPDHNQVSHTYSTTESLSTSSDRRLSNRSSKATARCSRLSSDTSSAQSITSSSGLGNAGGGGTFSDSGRSSSHLASGWSDRKDQGDSTKGVVVWSKQSGAGDSSLLDSEDDEEDDFESSSHESLRDAFWESILKEPAERTEEDVQILMENVQQLPVGCQSPVRRCRSTLVVCFWSIYFKPSNLEI